MAIKGATFLLAKAQTGPTQGRGSTVVLFEEGAASEM